MRIPLTQILYDGNIRKQFDETQIDGLARTMSLLGQQVPTKGRMVDGKCVLTDGMRRFLAARKLGWESLEVDLEEGEMKEEDILQRQLVVNCQRSDIPVLDKARAVARLMEVTGCNASEAAARLGMSNAMVTRLLSLLSLPEQIQRQVECGKLAPSTACELARVTDPARQSALVEAAMQGRLTRDAATAQRKRGKPRRARSAGSVTRAAVSLGEGRSITVASPDLSLETLIALLEELLGKCRKARSHGWELGTLVRALRDQSKT